MCGRVLDIRVLDKGGSQKYVMACGPVDRRANRAEWARAGPGNERPARASPYGPARAGSARRGPGF